MIHKISMIGPGGSGKTRLLLTAIKQIADQGWPTQHFSEWNEEMTSTIGGRYLNLGPLKLEDETKPVSFAIWDLGGQLRYSGNRKAYLENTQGILAVIDFCSFRSLELFRSAFINDEVAEVCDKNIPIFIVGNKVDLKNKIEDSSVEIAEEVYSFFQRIRDKNEVECDFSYKLTSMRRIKSIKLEKLSVGDRTAFRAADVEVLIYNVLKTNFSDILTTDMNMKLLSREFWLTLANMLYMNMMGQNLPFNTLENAFNRSPLLKEYSKDPYAIIPVDWSKDEFHKMVTDSMLQRNDITRMVNEISMEGLNIRGMLDVSAVKQYNSLESLSYILNETTDH
ncbi:MAG: ADP-ribosylation factor-like protein, partial [Candidatus Hodarchaeales archaeon]